MFLPFQRKHTEIAAQLEKPLQSSQPTLTAFATTTKWTSTDSRQVLLTNKLIDLIAVDLLPLSLADSPRFRTLMETAQPNFVIPSRKHLSTSLIPLRANSVQSSIKLLLLQTSSVCLTVDLWSSRDMRSYFGVTAHFISDYELKGVMLACTRFVGSHTADRIFAEYSDLAAKYDIKPFLVITDNAANMVKAFSIFPEELSQDTDEESDGIVECRPATDEFDYLPSERSPCFAHTLQLVVRDGLQHAGPYNHIISKMGRFVSHCRKSTRATDILEGTHRLQMANATRWNSQLTMLRSVLSLPNEILAQLDAPCKPSKHDLILLNELCSILQPFADVTNQIQGDQVITSSLVIVCIRSLRAQLSALKEQFNCQLVSTLQTSLEKRLSKYESMSHFQLAAILDPRFKLDWCDDHELQQNQLLLTTTWTDASSSSPATCATSSSDPPPAKRSKMFSFMASRGKPRQQQDREVTMYLDQPCISEDADPLHFWKSHRDEFPILSTLACQYLAIPASSAPVERIFSSAGKIFRPERCRLSDGTFQDLMLIRCNHTK